MKPVEFNQLMGELEGEVKKPLSDYEKFFASLPPLDYYSDLNLLMPLAWKHGIVVNTQLIDVTINGDVTVKTWLAFSTHDPDSFGAENKDPVEAIRQCLIEIAKDKL